jgi:hypothetical protein
MAKLLTVLAAASLALVVTAGTTAAQTNPYSPTGSHGYDTSSYQCSNVGVMPTGYTFGIVRVTGGRPFTVDSCRQALWTQAALTGKPSLYENVAYAGAYAHQVPPSCAAATSSENYSGKYLQAWQIGCAESDFAFNNRPSGSTAVAWWLDVEIGNSWSTSNRLLNQAAIDGAVDRLLSANVPVGVYSYASAWNTITTGPGWAPAKASASWVAGFSDCSHPFSSNLAVWLYQSGTTTWGADADYAC